MESNEEKYKLSCHYPKSDKAPLSSFYYSKNQSPYLSVNPLITYFSFHLKMQ